MLAALLAAAQEHRMSCSPVQLLSYKSEVISGVFEKGGLLLSFPSAGYFSKCVCVHENAVRGSFIPVR